MRKFILQILLLSFVSIAAHALQIKPTKDNEKIDATISARELSRIFVDGDRIQSTRGLNGAYELIKDEQQGSLFIKPTPFYLNKGFNLFITTEQGHNYNLFLAAKDVPAETIEIKSLSPTITLAEHWEKNSPYLETITQLMNFMANDTKPEGYAVIHLTKVKPQRLTNGLSMKLITLYRGNHLQGEIWLIKNEGRQTLLLNPRNYFQDKARAISLEDEILTCGSETYLYRIVDHG